MNNFNICYNALCRAFDKENVIVPPTLVEILKPQHTVYSSAIHTNTNEDECESSIATSGECSDEEESDESDNIDSSNLSQANSKRRKADNTTEYLFSIFYLLMLR